jgi:ankyrin repeat protein
MGHLSAVKLLLESGADMSHTRMDNGATCLFMAAQGGHVEVVGLLLEAGANVDQRSTSGRSPLFVAALAGHTGVVGLLLGAGANKKVSATAVGRGVAVESTPLTIATDLGHNNVVVATRSPPDSRAWEWNLTWGMTAKAVVVMALAWITELWHCWSRHWAESADSPGCQFA